MTSKYDYVTEYAEKLALERIPGEVTYRRCTRMGGKHDNLSIIVEYHSTIGHNGHKLWKSRGEVVNIIPSYIHTDAILTGSLHNQPVKNNPV